MAPGLLAQYGPGAALAAGLLNFIGAPANSPGANSPGANSPGATRHSPYFPYCPHFPFCPNFPIRKFGKYEEYGMRGKFGKYGKYRVAPGLLAQGLLIIIPMKLNGPVANVGPASTGLAGGWAAPCFLYFPYFLMRKFGMFWKYGICGKYEI